MTVARSLQCRAPAPVVGDGARSPPLQRRASSAAPAHVLKAGDGGAVSVDCGVESEQPIDNEDAMS